MGSQLIAGSCLEGGRNDRRVTDRPLIGNLRAGADLRLVGKNAQHARLAAELLDVRDVTAIDERLNHRRVHQIHPGGAIEPRVAQGVYVADVLEARVLEQHRVRRVDRLLLLDTQKGPRLEGGILERHDPAGKTAGPLVLVVEPGVDPKLLRALHPGGHDIEPGLAQILGQEADPAVKKRAAETTLLEPMELPIQLRGIKIIVERVKRHRSVGIGGGSESVLLETLALASGRGRGGFGILSDRDDVAGHQPHQEARGKVLLQHHVHPGFVNDQPLFPTAAKPESLRAHAPLHLIIMASQAALRTPCQTRSRRNPAWHAAARTRTLHNQQRTPRTAPAATTRPDYPGLACHFRSA